MPERVIVDIAKFNSLFRLKGLTMSSQQALAAAKVYRDLLKAVKKHIGKEEYKKHFSEYITQQFRKNSQLSDTSLVTQRIKLANDYAFLLNSVHHHKVLLSFTAFILDSHILFYLLCLDSL